MAMAAPAASPDGGRSAQLSLDLFDEEDGFGGGAAGGADANPFFQPSDKEIYGYGEGEAGVVGLGNKSPQVCLCECILCLSISVCVCVCVC